MNRFIRDNSGQSQIMAAMIAAVVLLATGYFSLQASRQAAERQTENLRLGEMRFVLDEAAKKITTLYHQSANCDAVTLNEIISLIKTDGSVAASGSAREKRQINYTINDSSYTVSIGKVLYVNAAGTESTLTLNGVGDDLSTWRSRDAFVELWTSGYQTRMSQQVALINTCTYPASTTQRRATPSTAQNATYSEYANQQPAQDTGLLSDFFSYNFMTPENFPPVDPPNASGVCAPDGSARSYGDVNFPNYNPPTSTDTNPDGRVEIRDVLALREYLRAGNYSFDSTQSPFVGHDLDGATSPACGDLNKDTLVTEADLNILEKYLRGYLYNIPVMY